MPVIQLLLLITGFVMLVKGADWFVDGCSGIAKQLGIPQIIIGLTIVAMGTSAPEAAVSITAALNGNADISVGNILGSNILNILIILGLTSVIVPLMIQRMTFIIDIPFMILITVILIILGMTDSCISRLESILLLILFITYLGYLFYLSRKKKEENTTPVKPVWQLILFMSVGAALVVLGSKVTVNSATELAEIIGLSKRFIGLTIVAFGTSLPELVTSVNAARKGNADIAIGNIIGSNIFNILFIIGSSALIVPITYDSNFIFDGIIAIISGIALWLFVLPKKKLCRSSGLIMLASYAAYLVILMI